MHKLSSGLLRAHTLGYTLTRRCTGSRRVRGGRERERESALKEHLARISPRKGSDPLTRVKLPHSLPRGPLYSGRPQVHRIFPRSVSLRSLACFYDSPLPRAETAPFPDEGASSSVTRKKIAARRKIEKESKSWVSRESGRVSSLKTSNFFLVRGNSFYYNI